MQRLEAKVYVPASFLTLKPCLATFFVKLKSTKEEAANLRQETSKTVPIEVIAAM
jgi:hypothetical protein